MVAEGRHIPKKEIYNGVLCEVGLKKNIQRSARNKARDHLPEHIKDVRCHRKDKYAKRLFFQPRHKFFSVVAVEEVTADDYEEGYGYLAEGDGDARGGGIFKRNMNSYNEENGDKAEEVDRVDFLVPLGADRGVDFPREKPDNVSVEAA